MQPWIGRLVGPNCEERSRLLCNTTPSWVLKEYADIIAQPVTSIVIATLLSSSYLTSWKQADVVPITKQKPVQVINKHLRPISLTPIISKLAEDFVVSALTSMLHYWTRATDGTGSTVRVVLFDYRKVFDYNDHQLLTRKIYSLDIPPGGRGGGPLGDRFLVASVSARKALRGLFLWVGPRTCWLTSGDKIVAVALPAHINDLRVP